MNTKVENKVTILSDTLKEFFGDKINLAHHIELYGESMRKQINKTNISIGETD
jgi:hypothetical protein